MKESIYNFCATKPDGTAVDFSIYQGKALLIVNTASACGFTPQYKQLEQLHQSYRGRGFEVLAFPSNDFGNQEAYSGQRLQEYCQIDQKLSYTVFDRVSVKGAAKHPVFSYLSDKKQNGVLNSEPRWNFHKYLLGRDGLLIDYFYSFTKPLSGRLLRKLEKAL